MTMEELFRLPSDMDRLRSLQIELADHENFNPYKGNIMSDMPNGSPNGRSFAESYVEKKEELEKKIEIVMKKIQEDRKIIDAYIKTIPYPDSSIVRYKLVNNMSWNDIGASVGYTGRWTRERFWKIVKDFH